MERHRHTPEQIVRKVREGEWPLWTREGSVVVVRDSQRRSIVHSLQGSSVWITSTGGDERSARRVRGTRRLPHPARVAQRRDDERAKALGREVVFPHPPGERRRLGQVVRV